MKRQLAAGGYVGDDGISGPSLLIFKAPHYSRSCYTTYTALADTLCVVVCSIVPLTFRSLRRYSSSVPLLLSSSFPYR